MEANYLQNLELFKTAQSFDFDIFEFDKTVGRSNSLTLLTIYLMRQLPG